LEALARQVGIERFVSFAGLIPHSDIMREYHQADIFCSTSLSESFSVVGLEAMACGLPVIATPTGFFREALRHEEVGMLVRFGAVDDLAAALRRLIMDRTLREAMGRRARELAVREYDWSIVARQYFALYQSIASRKIRGSAVAF
jgi:glycosyltransferase involved in cell wall biosynthesis